MTGQLTGSFTLRKNVEFSAAHSIKGAGKCENKHGHNWEAQITIHFAGELDERGFVVDVADVKKCAFKYDHDDLDKYFEFASTENVAAKIAEDVGNLCAAAASSGTYYIEVHLIETKYNSADAVYNVYDNVPSEDRF